MVKRIGKGGPQEPGPGVTRWPKPGGGKGAPKIAPWPLACSHILAQARIRNRNISGGGTGEPARRDFVVLSRTDSSAGGNHGLWQARQARPRGSRRRRSVLKASHSGPWELPVGPHLGRPCNFGFGQFGPFQTLKIPDEDFEEDLLGLLVP